MTPEQRQKVLAVIEKDCEIRARYADAEGRTCFIGGLLLDAGYKLSTLRKYKGQHLWNLPDRAIKALEKTYGLTRWDGDRLQYANDGVADADERRKAVRSKFLELFPEEGSV